MALAQTAATNLLTNGDFAGPNKTGSLEDWGNTAGDIRVLEEGGKHFVRIVNECAVDGECEVQRLAFGAGLARSAA